MGFDGRRGRADSSEPADLHSLSSQKGGRLLRDDYAGIILPAVGRTSASIARALLPPVSFIIISVRKGAVVAAAASDPFRVPTGKLLAR